MLTEREQKLPKWAQDELERLRFALERSERQRDNAQREAEKLSGERQEALDAIWSMAKTGNATALEMLERHQHGQRLREGHTDY